MSNSEKIFYRIKSTPSFNIKNVENSQGLYLIKFELLTFGDKSLKNKKIPWKNIEKDFNDNSDYFENIMTEIKEYSKRSVNFQTKDDKIKKKVQIQFILKENKGIHKYINLFN
jgi:hypothetical protein